MIGTTTWEEMQVAPSAVLALVRQLCARATRESIESLHHAIGGEILRLPPAARASEDLLLTLGRVLLADACRRETRSEADALCDVWVAAMTPAARERSLWHHLVALKANDGAERPGLVANCGRLIKAGCAWQDAQAPALDALLSTGPDQRSLLIALFGPAPIPMPSLADGQSVYAAIADVERENPLVAHGNVVRIALLQQCSMAGRRRAGIDLMFAVAKAAALKLDACAVLAGLAGGVELDATQVRMLLATEFESGWSAQPVALAAEVAGPVRLPGALALLRPLPGISTPALHKVLVPRLRAMGADFDAPVNGSAGYPTLHYCAAIGTLASAQAVLECGVDSRARVGGSATGATVREVIERRLATDQGRMTPEGRLGWIAVMHQIDAINARQAARRALLGAS